MGIKNAKHGSGIRIPKAAELIAKKIKHDIVTQTLKEGQLLPPEVKLMEEFGVSRPTIREAYRILEAERLVSVTRGAKGGALVHRPDPHLVNEYMVFVLAWERATMAEAYEARYSFEPEVVRIVASRFSDTAPSVLSETLERAKVLISKPEDFVNTMADFHEALVDLSQNHVLRLMSSTIRDVAIRHMVMVNTRIRQEEGEEKYLTSANKGVKSCTKLINLIKENQVDAAVDHWREHIKRANDVWLTNSDMLIQDLYPEIG